MMMETLSSINQQDKQQDQDRPLIDKKVEYVSATECANCGTTTTPLWRRGPNGETICNACGLYLKARNTLRPPTLKRSVHKKTNPEPKSDCGGGGGGTCPGGGQCNGTGGSSSCAGCPAFNQHQVNRQALICANCRTTTTPLWRRDDQGNTICNACGLYYKLHNVHRPVSMKRSIIKRRKRIVVAQGSDEEIEEDDEERSTRVSTLSPPLSDTVQVKKSKPQKVQHVAGQTAKRLHSTENDSNNYPNMNSPVYAAVPEIEDYVAPKKNKTTNLPLKKQQDYNNSNGHLSFSPTSAHHSHQQAQTPSPTQQQQTSTNNSSSEKTYPSNTTPLFTKPFPDQSQHNSFLPPISSERQSFRLESLFGRRESVSSTASSHTLPPLSLPPLTSPPIHNHLSISPPIQQHSHVTVSPSLLVQQQPSLPATQVKNSGNGSNNGYELADFDSALDRLEHLRRQVRPEQAYALSQLTQSITDLASKAEAILSLDSLAYGR